MREEIFEKEKQFHDQWASTIDVEGIRVRDYFEACTAPENRFILRQMGDISGKLLLDLGCGAGENSVYFAKKGARCIAADYSPGMVEVALQLAAANNVQIQGRTMNAIALDCPDNTFDLFTLLICYTICQILAAIKEMRTVFLSLR